MLGFCWAARPHGSADAQARDPDVVAPDVLDRRRRGAAAGGDASRRDRRVRQNHSTAQPPVPAASVSASRTAVRKFGPHGPALAATNGETSTDWNVDGSVT